MRVRSALTTLLLTAATLTVPSTAAKAGGRGRRL